MPVTFLSACMHEQYFDDVKGGMFNSSQCFVSKSHDLLPRFTIKEVSNKGLAKYNPGTQNIL